MKNVSPSCSIIVLNYFGEKVIRNTVESLLELNYPKEKIEIIIVDNNSQDKSRKIILDFAKKEKSIKYLFLDKNKGFAGGNNEGIKIAKGEYVALLNNDCVVDRNWLIELIKTTQKDPKIFAVSSKIKLFPKYYYLKFNYDNKLFLLNAYLNNSYLSVLEDPKKVKLNVLNPDDFYLLEIAYAPKDKVISLELNFEINKKDFKKSSAKLFDILNNEAVIGYDKKIINRNILSIKIKLNVDKFNNKNIYERIQNAGIMVFQDGSGRDIGARIYEQRQFYEFDSGQYSKEREIYAACGAAVLYNKKVLDKIGYLDEIFFMYYEDVEISERARLRGYKIFYSPKAEVRHLHAFSSKEWSNFFLYQAERGRLLHILFSFPFNIFLIEYFTMILRIGEVGLRILKGLSDRRRVIKFIKNIIAYANRTINDEENNKTDFGKVIQYIKIIIYLFVNFPILIFKRHQKLKFVSLKTLDNNYQVILSGRWYFN